MRKTLSLLAVLALAFGLLPPGVAQAAFPEPPLMLHELTPCVLFDTRPSQGGTGALAANEARTFHVVGSTSDFASQGGTAGGCGIPGFDGTTPQTEMVFLNLVAVDPAGGGNLKVWATDDTEPAGGVLNYQKLTPNLNIANALVTGVRKDSEGSDITVKANVSGTHVRGVALGYLTRGEVSFWSLEGNAGTDSSLNFLGTTDDTALNIRVNDQRAFRLEPNATSPNVIGGFSGNSVTGGVLGSTISGGGQSIGANQVTANFGTIGGGVNNMASGPGASIGGGTSNTASAFASMVPGGQSNTAAGEYSFAAGRQAQANHHGAFVWADSQDAGFASTAMNEFSVRAGGGVRFFVAGNTCSLDVGTGQWTGSCTPPVADAWLLGGNGGTTPGTDFLGTTDNTALELKVNTVRAFRLEPAGGSVNVLGGASVNAISPGALSVTISGGGWPGGANEVTDDLGTVGGGRGNQAGDEAGTTTDAQHATVGGGRFNTASGSESTVGGGDDNLANGGHATIGGGWDNQAAGVLSVIAGGGFNTVSGDSATIAGGEQNNAGGQGATIGGGAKNVTSADFATIGGGGGGTAGDGNQVTALGGTVGGGRTNTASGNLAAVGGGFQNVASGQGSFIGGGNGNAANGDRAVIGGGSDNVASVARTTVGGGDLNTASGLFATVPGGASNTAGGQWSFAAGRQAKANHQGSFVWADSQAADMASSGADQFILRAQGGFFLQSDSTLDSQGGFLNTTTGAFLSGAGVWTNASSRDLKAGFLPVDGGDILDRVASLPITTWQYRAEPGVLHIGPVAEDFQAAFGVGADDKSIGTVDADGVALAAIQGLQEVVEAQQAEITELREASDGGAGGKVPWLPWAGALAGFALCMALAGRRRLAVTA